MHLKKDPKLLDLGSFFCNKLKNTCTNIFVIIKYFIYLQCKHYKIYKSWKN